MFAKVKSIQPRSGLKASGVMIGTWGPDSEIDAAGLEEFGAGLETTGTEF